MSENLKKRCISRINIRKSSNYRKYYLYLQAKHPTPSLGTCLICISCSQTHALIQFCILEICVQFNEELHIELNDAMTLTERNSQRRQNKGGGEARRSDASKENRIYIRGEFKNFSV